MLRLGISHKNVSYGLINITLIGNWDPDKSKEFINVVDGGKYTVWECLFIYNEDY